MNDLINILLRLRTTGICDEHFKCKRERSVLFSKRQAFLTVIAVVNRVKNACCKAQLNWLDIENKAHFIHVDFTAVVDAKKNMYMDTAAINIYIFFIYRWYK